MEIFYLCARNKIKNTKISFMPIAFPPYNAKRRQLLQSATRLPPLAFFYIFIIFCRLVFLPSRTTHQLMCHKEHNRK